MPCFKSPLEQIPVTRKPGETTTSLRTKYRNSRVKLSATPVNPYEPIMKSSYCAKPADFSTGTKREIKPKREPTPVLSSKLFIATSTNQNTFNVTNELTRQTYERPQVRAACEIALEKGSDFKKKKASSGMTTRQRELLVTEKARVGKLKRPTIIQSPMSRVNMPNYTGHEPQSPQNARGPYRSGIETTSGRANHQGLGQMLA